MIRPRDGEMFVTSVEEDEITCLVQQQEKYKHETIFASTRREVAKGNVVVLFPDYEYRVVRRSSSRPHWEQNRSREQQTVLLPDGGELTVAQYEKCYPKTILSLIHI